MHIVQREKKKINFKIRFYDLNSDNAYEYSKLENKFSPIDLNGYNLSNNEDLKN